MHKTGSQSGGSDLGYSETLIITLFYTLFTKETNMLLENVTKCYSMTDLNGFARAWSQKEVKIRSK